MATEAQIEANRKNATASTGPRTPDGKSKSSGNAVSHGLFSTRVILDSDAAEEFNQLAAGMQKDLAPEGTLEQTFADEITRAAFRLRRCAHVEDGPSEDGCTGLQISVDRARAEAHRILKRSMDELRRLQNERRFRFEILNEGVDSGDLGLASYKDLMPAMAAEKRWQLLGRQVQGLGDFQSLLERATSPPPPEAFLTKQASVTKRTQSAPPTPETASTKRTQSVPAAIQALVPRNAPCPCGSGKKYKRCCGTNAPAVLGMAA